MQRLITHLVLALSAAWAIGPVAHAQTAEPRAGCPPVAQMPTQEQIAEGLRNATDRGALWALAKDGRTSYLYGTLHVGQMAWAFPGPNLVKAIQQTQVLAVEVDISAPTLQAEMQTAMAEKEPLALSAQEQARLDAQADAACIPRQALAALHPVMQAITYVALSGRHDGLDPGFAQEASLIGAARARQVPVVSLESIGEQMKLLVPRDAATARQALDRILGGLESGRSQTELLRTSRAWERGDMDTLSSLEKLCQCQPTAEERDFMTRLLDGRNPALAQRIASEHAKGQPVLAAVGILHMTGPQALQVLLQQQGFVVTQLHPKP